MPGFLEILCPVCGEEVPDSGFKRVRVPSHSGRRMRVHAGCAEMIAAQGTLEQDGKVLGEPVRERPAA